MQTRVLGQVSGRTSRPSLCPRITKRGAVRVSAYTATQQAANNVEEARANVRAKMQWFRIPPKVYFKGGCLEVALQELKGKKRAFIVTDKAMFDLEYAEKVTRILNELNVQHQVWFHAVSDPSISTVKDGLRELREFKPDVIIAVGGGSPMDAAKAMWYFYERPDAKFEDLLNSASESRKQVTKAETLGTHALCICVPTTSGTGSEVVPFAQLKDDTTGKKYTLADYSMTPSMAIVDPQLVMNLPRKQTAYGGMTTLSHALESYMSVFSSDFTRGQSKHALTMMTRYFARAYKNGPMDYHAREKMHNAATVAGMAFSNTYLGACHALASELTSDHGINIGLAKGLLIVPVVRFMSQDKLTKQFLAELAEHLHLGGTSEDDKLDRVIAWVQQQKAAADIPSSIKEVLGEGKKEVFLKSMDSMTQSALQDPHMVASPVQPSAEDLKNILIAAWEGRN